VPAPTTLHVFDARALGEFAALATRAHLGERDAVLTIGSARQARPIAQLLGRPVRNHPVRRGASARSIDAIARRTARSLGAGEIRHASGGDGAAPDLGALPSRDEARAQVGCEGLLTVAPLTDRPGSVDARALLFVAGLLEIVGDGVALLLPGCARRLQEALTYLHNAGLRTPVRIVEGAWIAALPAADVFIEPADAEQDPSRPHAVRLAERLGIPRAPTAAWRLDPDAATHSLPSEIRATVGPVLERARAARSATVSA